MIPGYNHNVRYKDRVYHVQTEDSGLRNPVLITHLFFGGTILATQRSAYGDILGVDGRDSLVRTRMQDQHKTMLRNLVAGAMDNVLARLWGPGLGATAEGAAEVGVSGPPTMPDLDAAALQFTSTAPPNSFPPVNITYASPIAASSISASPVAPSPIAASSISASPVIASPMVASSVVVPVPAARRPAVAPVALPLIARAAHTPSAQVVRQAPAVPPAPPAPVQPTPAMAGPVVARVLVPSGPSARPQPTIAPPSPPAPTRKDARGSPTPVAPPHYPGAPVLKSPFGGDLVSDKSLDDVILTYLAEEFLDDAQDDKGSDGGAP